MEKVRSPIARIAWVCAAAVGLLAIENIWIDARVARRLHGRVPSLIPEALGGAWFLVLLGFALALTLAVICVVLLMRDGGFAGWKKALTGAAVLAAAILAGDWVVATGGIAALGLAQPATASAQVAAPGRDHKVTLSWKASTTKNVKYNVYRGTAPGFHPDKLNATPQDGLTYTDTTADNGVTYYYVTRAIDANGRESVDSNETIAKVPPK